MQGRETGGGDDNGRRGEGQDGTDIFGAGGG